MKLKKYALITLLSFTIIGSSVFGKTPPSNGADELAKISADLDRTFSELEKHIDRVMTVDGKKLKGLIAAYNTTTDPKTKLALAVWANLFSDMLVFPQNKGIKLTPLEKEVLTKIAGEMKEIQKKADEFESHFDVAAVNFITQDNPDSIFRRLKWIRFSGSMKCPSEEYENLKSKLGLKEMIQRATKVMALISTYEGQFIGKYSRRVLELIQTRADYSAAGSNFQNYYQVGILINSQRDPAQMKTYIERYERDLMETGLSKSEIKPYVLATAELAPHCLSGINPKFAYMMSDDVTKTRGNFLLGKLIEKWEQTGVLATDLVDVITTSNDPLFGKTVDGRYQDYEIKVEGNKVSLISKGSESSDYKDIIIGPAVLK